MATYRTTIVLPLPLKRAVSELAHDLGISLGEFVRRALEKELRRQASDDDQEPDPLLDDTAVYRGRVPKNLSKDHDAYLYGES